jgi:hypothetical protein
MTDFYIAFFAHAVGCDINVEIKKVCADMTPLMIFKKYCLES